MKKFAIIILLIFPAVLFSSPIRSNLGGDGEEYIDAAAPTAADYISDGMVAMYDGIENAGVGVHDSYSLTWVDLIGGIGDLPVIGNPNWTESSFDFAGTSFFRSSSQELANIVLSGEYTIEMYLRPNPSGNRNGGMIAVGANDSRIFWIWEASGADKFVQSISTAQGILWSNSYGSSRNADHLLQISVSHVYGASYFDGVRYKTVSNPTTTAMTPSGFEIGRLRVNAANQGYIGNLQGCCFRVYNRALSEAELVYNYMIDIRRFGL